MARSDTAAPHAVIVPRPDSGVRECRRCWPADAAVRRPCLRPAARCRLLPIDKPVRSGGFRLGATLRRRRWNDSRVRRFRLSAAEEELHAQRPAGPPLPAHLTPGAPPAPANDTVRAALRRHGRTPGSGHVRKTYRVYACFVGRRGGNLSEIFSTHKHHMNPCRAAATAAGCSMCRWWVPGSTCTRPWRSRAARWRRSGSGKYACAGSA